MSDSARNRIDLAKLILDLHVDDMEIDPEEGTDRSLAPAVYDHLTEKVIASTIVVVTAIMAASLFVIPEARLRLLVIMGVVTLVGSAALVLNRRGRSRLAGWILVSTLLTLTSGLSLTGGGITSPALIANVPVILVAGLLLGEVAALLIGGIAALVGFGLAALEVREGLPPSLIDHTPYSYAMAYLVSIGLAIALERLAARTMQSALDKTRAELAERLRAQGERDQALADLRERIKEIELLYAVSRLLRPDRPFDRDLLEDAVRLLPSGWLHPGECVARISWQGIEAASPRWRESPWMISTTFGESGRIEVTYLVELPLRDHGPFLKEEIRLLASLGDLLGSHLAQKRAEEQQRQLEEQLRRSQKLQALGTLSGGIAHDFNNLLASIRANIDLAIADLEVTHPARESVTEVARAGVRASDLVRRILLFSRQEEGAFRPMAVPPVIEDAVRLLRAGAPTGVQIVSTFAPDLPNIVGDATQFHQVIMNLGTNAMHAMSERGGTLNIDVERVLISPEADGTGRGGLPSPHLHIAVRDSGSGMSREVMDRIFEPFFTTKGPDKGTGLGLSVVHGIVAAHGGSIGVESVLDRGTSFHILLPATEREEVLELKESVLFEGSGERILYVDDDETLSFVMTRLLRRLKYEPKAYTDPHAALHAFRTRPHDFDAAVVDSRMPQMTGASLASELQSIRPDLPVTITSGDRGVEAEDAVRKGGWGFIPKPSSLEDLSASLREMLARR